MESASCERQMDVEILRASFRQEQCFCQRTLSEKEIPTSPSVILQLRSDRLSFRLQMGLGAGTRAFDKDATAECLSRTGKAENSLLKAAFWN